MSVHPAGLFATVSQVIRSESRQQMCSMSYLALLAAATAAAVCHAQYPRPYGGGGRPPLAPPDGPLLLPTARPLAAATPAAYADRYYSPGLAAAAPILTYSSEQDVDGSYAFSFSTADGKQAQESGFLRDAYVNNAGEPEGVQVVQGSYSYTAPDGTPVQVTYTADENGFHPQGVHIPADGRFATLPRAGVLPGATAADPARYNSYYDRNQYDRFSNQYGRYGNQYGRNGNQYGRYDNPYDRNRFNPLGQYDRYNRYNSRYNSYPVVNPLEAAMAPRLDTGDKKN